jgi:hypothetical protein
LQTEIDPGEDGSDDFIHFGAGSAIDDNDHLAALAGHCRQMHPLRADDILSVRAERPHRLFLNFRLGEKISLNTQHTHNDHHDLLDRPHTVSLSVPQRICGYRD